MDNPPVLNMAVLQDRAFEVQVSMMSEEQAKEFLLNFYREWKQQKQAYTELIGQLMGVTNGTR